MGKKCHNCEFEVEESYTGSCPSCKEEKGYEISRSVSEKGIKISDGVSIDLKKVGLDPNRILEIGKMLNYRNEQMAEAMAPLGKMLNEQNEQMAEAMAPLGKMLNEQNEQMAEAMRPLSRILKSEKMKKLQQQVKSINDAVSTQMNRLSELNLQVAKLPEEDIKELKDIKENVDEQKKNSDFVLENIQTTIEKQHQEQKDMHEKTHDRLSPKATIGVALVASIVGGIISGFIVNFLL